MLHIANPSIGLSMMLNNVGLSTVVWELIAYLPETRDIGGMTYRLPIAGI